MQWFDAPKEAPSIIFPIGAVVEDQKAIYKILSEPDIQGFIHSYKIEVLKQKEELTEELKFFLSTGRSEPRLIVLAQNLDKIKRLS